MIDHDRQRRGEVPLANRPRADLVVANAAELMTCAPGASDLVGRVAGGSVAVAGERIVAVGSADEGLAEFCDVYCDEGYFTAAQSERILTAGLAHGLWPKIHLDQYSYTGAARLAAEVACVSADHLNFTPPEELDLLAQAGVIAVPLPGLDFAVAHRQPVDIRRLIAHGLEIALATDICPGCWLPSMQLVIALACRLYRLSPAEAIRAATLGAAHAIGRGEEIGSLEPGKLADLLVLDVDRHEDLAYKLGRNAVETVVKRGRVVVEGSRLVEAAA